MAFNKMIFAVALSICAAPVFAQDMGSTNSTTVVTPADFAWDAALINLKEIRLGEAAQSNSQNSAVQDFGKHMVRDHMKMQDHLVKIATAEGLPLPDTNTFYVTVTPPEKPATALMQETPQERLLEAQLDVQSLVSLTGPAFDQAYANAMVAGHEKAIQEYQEASSSLQDEQLKKYADKGLRAVGHHLEMAKDLQTNVMQSTNAPASSGGTPPM